mmetsp:Transcript_92142/g.264102  ORF Transcript_92142/g.264102 Transcript_92142/m.264102 type:complete len:240 (-) Transcript_92142:262-981(-)
MRSSEEGLFATSTRVRVLGVVLRGKRELVRFHLAGTRAGPHGVHGQVQTQASHRDVDNWVPSIPLHKDEPHEHGHNRDRQQGDQVLLQQDLEGQRARRTRKLLGLSLQVGGLLRNRIKGFPAEHQLVDVALHDVRDLRKIRLKLHQDSARRRVAVLDQDLRDVAVEAAEIVRLVDTLEARPVVDGAGAELALELLLEEQPDVLQVCEGHVARVIRAEEAQEANSLGDAQVPDEASRALH